MGRHRATDNLGTRLNRVSECRERADDTLVNLRIIESNYSKHDSWIDYDETSRLCIDSGLCMKIQPGRFLRYYDVCVCMFHLLLGHDQH